MLTSYRLYVLDEGDVGLPRISLRDHYMNWYIVLSDDPYENFSEDDQTGVKHVATHVNVALKTGVDGARWRFIKCLKDLSGQMRNPRTGEEPLSHDMDAVKLYVCEKDGFHLDVSLFTVPLLVVDNNELTNGSIQRVVVKTGIARQDGKDNTKEVMYYEALAKRETQDCIVRFRGWSRHQYLPRELHTYIAWASHGSLRDLVLNFDQSGRTIPGMFIWLVMRNLVRACKLLEGQGLVYPDIKFRNIFLADSRGSTDYPSYCNPVLEDFDVMASIKQVINGELGTLGWQTFEQLPEDIVPSIEKLHVQAIGQISLALWTRSIDGTWVEGFAGLPKMPGRSNRPFRNGGDPTSCSFQLRQIISRSL